MDVNPEYQGRRPRGDGAGSRVLRRPDTGTEPPDPSERPVEVLVSAHCLLAPSSTHEPAVRLLQLFAFADVRSLPARPEGTLGWALRNELVRLVGDPCELDLTPKGDEIVREWSSRTIIP